MLQIHQKDAKLDECGNEKKVDEAMFKKLDSLRYLCNNTSDIFYAISIISRFINEHRKLHLVAIKGYLDT